MIICRISTILADLLCKENIILKKDKEIYEYGFQITMANITNFFIVLIIGLIFDSVFNVFIFYLVFITLRIFCGGLHAKSYARCFLLFGAACCVCLLSGRILEGSRYLSLSAACALILQGLCTYGMAPIEHANRPLTEAERERFKGKSWLVLVVWALAVASALLFRNRMAASMISVTVISVSILMIMAYLRGGE